MDYEKKYKEALNLARSYYDENTNQFLDTIFPELKESENEKIRKALIEVLHRLPTSAFDGSAEGGYLGATKEQMLAYLEKQKFKNDEEEYLDGIKRDWFERGKKEVLTVPELYGLEKQKEHHIPWYDYQKSKEAGYTIVPNEEYEQLIKQKEQKLTENEDDKMIDEIINTVTGYHPTHSTKEINEMVSWLKGRKGLFAEGLGHYFYDGDKAHFCSAPAMEVRELDDSNEPVEHWQYVGEVNLEEDKKEQKEYVSDNFDDVWATEDCAEIIEAGEKLSPRFKELFKEVCHAWYDKGIELGKHKEQKPNIELIQKSWYMEGYHDRKFNREPKWVIKTGEGGPRYEENPKYGQSLIEQRPTEEQLHNLNEAIKSFRMDGFDRIADSLHSLYNCILKTQEQKSAECSVKGRRGRIGITPKHIRKKAENFLSKMDPPYDADDVCSAYETGAMESIKQEWSEDEERLINTSISFLKDFADKGYENAVECVDWLKSKLNGNTCK